VAAASLKEKFASTSRKVPASEEIPAYSHTRKLLYVGWWRNRVSAMTTNVDCATGVTHASLSMWTVRKRNRCAMTSQGDSANAVAAAYSHMATVIIMTVGGAVVVLVLRRILLGVGTTTGAAEGGVAVETGVLVVKAVVAVAVEAVTTGVATGARGKPGRFVAGGRNKAQHAKQPLQRHTG